MSGNAKQTKPVIIIGAGGHAKVIIDILSDNKIKIAGIVDIKYRKGQKVYGIDVIGNDDELEKIDAEEYMLINAIGYMPEGKPYQYETSNTRRKPMKVALSAQGNDLNASVGVSILAFSRRFSNSIFNLSGGWSVTGRIFMGPISPKCWGLKIHNS